MGSSKFEFETYKTKRFKTNKLGEREYIVGCVPYKISPLVCHCEDAVRKEHNVFLLVRPREENVTPAASLVVLPQYELVPKLEFVPYYY